MKVLKLLGAALAAVTMTFTAQAEDVAKAVFDDETHTLTFYFDSQTHDGQGEVFEVPEHVDQYWPWQVQRARTSVTHVFFDESFKNYKPLSCQNWFEDFPRLQSVSGLENLNVTYVTSTHRMFYQCVNLISADLSGWGLAVDLSNMSEMFSGCHSLRSVNVNGFHPCVSHGWSTMAEMFYNCYSLTQADFSGAVFLDLEYPDMGSMFENCTNLTTVVMPEASPANTLGMFDDCSALTSVDLSRFSTENNQYMVNMFMGCSRLETIDLSSFSSKSLEDTSGMFWGCESLRTIYATDDYAVSTRPSSLDMFKGCTSLPGYSADRISSDYGFIGEGGYFTRGTAPMAVYDDFEGTLTFYYDASDHVSEGRLMKGRYTLFEDGSSWRIDDVTSSVTRVVFDSSFKGYHPTTCSGWFEGCAQLREVVGLEYLNVDRSVSTDRMFKGCALLESLELSGFDTARVRNMQEMFAGCAALREIYVSSKFVTKLSAISYPWQTSTLYTGQDVFKGCTSLPGFSPSRTDAKYAKVYPAGYFTKHPEPVAVFSWGSRTLTFYRDSYNHSSEGVVYEVGNVTGGAPDWSVVGGNVATVVFDRTFSGCRPRSCWSWFEGFTNATSFVGMENLDTSLVKNFQYMFRGCSALTEIDVSWFRLNSATSMYGMFNGCSSLTELDLSAWNASSVQSFDYMFAYCYNLERIFVSRKFGEIGSENQNVFFGCLSLYGDHPRYDSLRTYYSASHVDGEYGRINQGGGRPGYLSEAPHAYARLDENERTLTFLCDYDYFDTDAHGWYEVSNMVDRTHWVLANRYRIYEIDLDGESYLPGWDQDDANVDTIVFDDSFRKARPKSTARWFFDMRTKTASQIVNLDALDTSRTVNMSSMFYNCQSLESIDLSHFDTSNVKDFSCLFYNCSNLTELNLSAFTARDDVEDVRCIFYNCESLTTIYAASDFKLPESGLNCFRYCDSLVGGEGTKCAGDGGADGIYGRADGGPSAPGYFVSSDAYTIRFAAGGGAGAMAVQHCAHGRVYALAKCAFKAPDGKTFAGWRSSKNGKLYADGILVFDLAEPGETVTMTAIWK